MFGHTSWGMADEITRPWLHPMQARWFLDETIVNPAMGRRAIEAWLRTMPCGTVLSVIDTVDDEEDHMRARLARYRKDGLQWHEVEFCWLMERL